MKLQDADIFDVAHNLRDEQNKQFHVAPSPLAGRRNPTPLWLAATAAALVIGFFVGQSLTLSPSPVCDGGGYFQELSQSQSSGVNTPLSHEEEEGDEATIIREVVHDTIFETRIVRVPVPQMATAQVALADTSPGCSMLCDEIRYDLLTKN